MNLSGCYSIFWALALLGSVFLAPDKVVCAQIVLGQSCALSGPTSFLGTEMRKGALAFFKSHAPNIILESRDDKYEPVQCIENTNYFIQKKVTALFGYVGTPTSKVAVPIATKNHFIYFGAFTGASFLSDYKKNPYSFSVRASYNAEIENMVRRLKEDLNITKIGLFVQRDAYGMAGVKGLLRAVKVIKGVEITPPVPPIPKDDAPQEEWDKFWRHVPNYKRNTVAVGRGARQVSGNGAEAVVLIGAYRPCAAAINLWRRIGYNVPAINISFVGTVELGKRLNKTENVYVTQVVPDPWDDTLPIVKEYHRDLKDRKYGFVSLEGYIAAKVFAKAIKNAGSSPDSDTLKLAIESMQDYEAGGFKVSFGPRDHRGMDNVYFTKIEKDKDGLHFPYVNKLVFIK